MGHRRKIVIDWPIDRLQALSQNWPQNDIWDSFKFIPINIQALRGAFQSVIFKTQASILHQNQGSTLIGPHRTPNQLSLAPISLQSVEPLHHNWGQWELVKYSVRTNESASPILVQDWSSGFKDYNWKCLSQRLNIDWNELKIISDVNLLMWES